jgi:hypothetical protein
MTLDACLENMMLYINSPLHFHSSLHLAILLQTGNEDNTTYHKPATHSPFFLATPRQPW